TKRRITFPIKIAYDTPGKKVKNCVQRIEYLLKNHEEVDQDYILVRFDGLKETSMEIYLYFFTKTTVWLDWFKVKEDITLEILRILDEENVTLAIPVHHISIDHKNDGDKISAKR